MARLQTLKPQVRTIPGRIQMAATLSTQRMRGRAAVEHRAKQAEAPPNSGLADQAAVVGK